MLFNYAVSQHSRELWVMVTFCNVCNIVTSIVRNMVNGNTYMVQTDTPDFVNMTHPYVMSFEIFTMYNNKEVILTVLISHRTCVTSVTVNKPADMLPDFTI